MMNNFLKITIVAFFICITAFAEDNQVSKIIIHIDKTEHVSLSKEDLLENTKEIVSADEVDLTQAIKNADSMIDGINEKNQSDIIVDGMKLYNKDEIIKNLLSYIGKEIDEELILDLKNDIAKELNKRGFYFFAINVEEQWADNEPLQVNVIFGRLGKVEVNGSCHYPKERIARQIRACPGEIINPYIVEKDIMWLNENPYRSVSLVYTPGEKTGTTDIILNVDDRRYYRVYSGYEMTDNNVAGNSRFFAGFNFGKLPLGSQINYQFMFAPDVNRWYAHTASLIIPLPIRNIIKVVGSYVETKPKALTNFDLKGKSYTVSAHYIIPKVFNDYIKYQFLFGYGFQRTNNFTDFISNQISTTDVDISQFVINFDINFNDKYGSTQLSTYGYISPGKMSKFNHTEFFDAVREGASAGYGYFVGSVDRIFNLPYKMKYFISLKGQASGAKLMPTEALSLGGFHSVRGYRENALVGDFGYLVRNEFHAPPVRLFSYLNLFDGKSKKSDEKLTFLAFVDYGRAFEVDKNIQNRESSWLMSSGPGLRYSISQNLFFRLDYGFQINRIIDGQKNQWHLQLLLSY